MQYFHIQNPRLAQLSDRACSLKPQANQYQFSISYVSINLFLSVCNLSVSWLGRDEILKVSNCFPYTGLGLYLHYTLSSDFKLSKIKKNKCQIAAVPSQSLELAAGWGGTQSTLKDSQSVTTEPILQGSENQSYLSFGPTEHSLNAT